MNAFAHARPMPLLPPVMRTFLSLRPRSIRFFPLFRGDFPGLDELAEALHLGRDELAGFLGRGDERVEALLRELLAHFGRSQSTSESSIQATDHLARRAG